jgi:hypothetical protein
MTHLSAEQIAQWVAGQRAAEVESHMAGCSPCRAQVAEFEDVLAQFRGSLKSVPVAPPVLDARRIMLWPRLVAIGAAAAMLLLVPVYRDRQARARAAIEQQDAQLLQQVDSEVSRAVPDAMAPLVKMVSWNSYEAQK